MIPRDGLRRAAALLAAPRYEVFPAASVEQAILDWVPRELTVTVTASPVKGLGPTLDLTERLSAHGYRVVPHLSARLVHDEAHLTDIVARLRVCGVDDVFVPAGDADPPLGRFDSALGLLNALAEMDRPFSRAGVTGYPQSHPKIGDDITVQAMWDKRHHAAYLVSNLCFNPATLRQWISRVRARGVTLPLFVGLSGPVNRPGCCGWRPWPGSRSRPGSCPGTPSGSCGSARPAATARTGCSNAPAAR